MSMIILSLDYGERYVGVAVTDPDGQIALRHSFIDQTKQDALKEIILIVQNEKATKVLVGVPISLSGKQSEQSKSSLVFIDQLGVALGHDVTITGVDETFTSVEAERRLKAEGADHLQAHAEAARLMLDQYLKQQQVKSNN